MLLISQLFMILYTSRYTPTSVISPFLPSIVVVQSLKGLWSPHMGCSFNLIKHSVGLFWTSEQPVAKASTYAGHHNIERRGQTSVTLSDLGLCIRPRSH
jgi:hypothetical protein